MILDAPLLENTHKFFLEEEGKILPDLKRKTETTLNNLTPSKEMGVPSYSDLSVFLTGNRFRLWANGQRTTPHFRALPKPEEGVRG